MRAMDDDDSGTTASSVERTALCVSPHAEMRQSAFWRSGQERAAREQQQEEARGMSATALGVSKAESRIAARSRIGVEDSSITPDLSKQELVERRLSAGRSADFSRPRECGTTAG
jgi:hypothetical protein